MKRLLLAGGGQAQLFALGELARNAPRDVEITLVTPNAELLYSAMLPGWIARHYTRAGVAILFGALSTGPSSPAAPQAITRGRSLRFRCRRSLVPPMRAW